MKKILSLLMLIFTLSIVAPQAADAQVYYYKTTAYAYKKVNSYGNWNNWSEWMKSNMTMTINFNTDVVTINSPKKQVYRITEFIRNFTDSSGGRQVELSFIDQDGDRGHMRLRIETNGNSQVYVEYANLMLVWNVRRIN